MAIKIPFLSDASQVLRSTSDIEGALDQVADSLDDVAKEAQRSGAKIGTGITDGTKDADRSVERLERSFSDLSKAARQESKEAGDSIGKNVRRGTDDAEDGVRDFKQEAKQNAEEVASSFDGSAASIADGFQSVTATAFAGFGPAAAIAGLAAAAGLGIAFNYFTEQSEEQKQRAEDMFQDMIDSGNNYASATFVNQSIQEIINDEGKWNQVKKDSIALGLDEALVLRATAGDAQALAQVLAVATQQQDEATAAKEAYTGQSKSTQLELNNEARAASDLTSKFAALVDSTDDAAGRANAYRQAAKDAADATDVQTGKVAALAQRLAELPNNKTIRLDVDDSALERALTRQQGRVITVNVEGQITRIGNQVY